MKNEEDVKELKAEKGDELIKAEGSHRIYTLQVEIRLLTDILEG